MSLRSDIRLRTTRLPAWMGLTVALGMVLAGAGVKGPLAAEPAIREIGAPVQSVNWVRLHPGHDRDGEPRIYATMGQQADNLFVLEIDP
ncbi:MAG: hypothetical protein ABIK89_14125, partial [Planctomycetota bacterium]